MNNEENFDLIQALNSREIGSPFQASYGPLHQKIPPIKESGGCIVSTPDLLKYVSSVLSGTFPQEENYTGPATPFDDEESRGIEETYPISLPDAVFIYGSSVKVQPYSGFLTGLLSSDTSNREHHIMVDSASVEHSIRDGHFGAFDAEKEILTKLKTLEGGFVEYSESSVVFLPYDHTSVRLSPEQFKAIDAESMSIDDLWASRDDEVYLSVNNIFDDKQNVVVSPFTLYPNDKIWDFMSQLEKYSGRVVGGHAEIGFFYTPQPKEDIARMYNLCMGITNGMLIRGTGLQDGEGRLLLDGRTSIFAKNPVDCNNYMIWRLQ